MRGRGGAAPPTMLKTATGGPLDVGRRKTAALDGWSSKISTATVARLGEKAAGDAMQKAATGWLLDVGREKTAALDGRLPKISAATVARLMKKAAKDVGGAGGGCSAPRNG